MCKSEEDIPLETSLLGGLKSWHSVGANTLEIVDTFSLF